MAETPEEVAKKLLYEITDCENCDAGHWNCSPPTLPHLASALRAQYVAGLERGAQAAVAFGSNEAQAIGRRIRELAEQAKREGT